MKPLPNIKDFIRNNKPQPSAGLGPPGRKLWEVLQEGYQIKDAGGLVLLATACKAEDELAAMRAIVEVDGLTVLNHFQEKKPHPLLQCIRGTEATKVRAINALHLGPPKGASNV